MKTILATTALLFFTLPAMAEPEQLENTSGRYEVWMGIMGWPGISNLQPLVAGSFDEVGTVHDEGVFLTPLLGSNAGILEGPVYLLQVGFSGR